MTTDNYHKRLHELNEVLEIFDSERAQFVYVRGRRRVGKSWILAEAVKRKKGKAFYFSGSRDSNTRSTIGEFISTWIQFFPNSLFRSMRIDRLGWKGVFNLILKDLQSKSRHPTPIIFDEIQWIAKEGGGFIGALKEAWLEIERSNLAHIIVCGSSNKFFADHVGGEEKILRGLQTRSPLWIEPLSLHDVQKIFFPSWSKPQVTLLYMLIGGIPYYLQQFDEKLGFVHAINNAIFSKETIFLSEIEEILGLDFNAKSMINVQAILGALAVYGGSQATTRKKIKLSVSSTSEIFAKLLQYKLIYQEQEYEKAGLGVAVNESNYFSIGDYYLNSYFALMQPLQNSIAKNTKGRVQIFGERILDGSHYYIPEFSGKCFEHLIYRQLQTAKLNSPLLKKLRISSYDFSLYTRNQSQFDIILYDKLDRTVRVIECKWSERLDPKWLEQLKAKPLILTKHQTRMDILVVSGMPTKQFKQNAKELGVVIVELADLFLDG
jgi:hypothetical protein